MRPRAVLFDLDGTLVETAPRFYADYMTLLARRCGDPGVVAAVVAATERVRAQGPAAAPVGERILAAAAAGLGRGPAWLAAVFARLYTDDYPTLRPAVGAVPGAGELLRAAARTGASLVLASEPVFPRQRILDRLIWGGLDPAPFEWSPGCDEAHALKPHRGYYLEIAAHLGLAPEDCLMIGNDPERDLPAAEAGLRVFLLAGAGHAVTDRPGVSPEPPPGVHAGGIAEAVALLAGDG